MFGRRRQQPSNEVGRNDSDDTLAPELEPSRAQVSRATRTRLIWSLLSAFCLLISVVFLILVEVGNTSVGSTLNKIYFININIADIVPVNAPGTLLINSIAETLGLHDFYTVGLWNYCEGYDNQGVTGCAATREMFWFNPVAVIQGELLAGAEIELPAQITSVLKPIRVASHWMFPLFLAGVCLNFLMMLLTPLAVFSRWATLPIMVFTFIGALLTTGASVVATVLFIIMKNAITSVMRLNITASLGKEMFAFMWVASGFAIIAWLIQLCLCCCCASRRDVSSGRKAGSKKAWRTEGPKVGEKTARGIHFRRSQRQQE